MRPLSCYLLALFFLLLSCGIVDAQVSGGGGALPFTCAVNTATPTLRAEGFTEEIGDIVVSCTGGAILAPGQPIPAVDITIFLPTQITSQLLNGNASEALLLIDDPNSGLPAPVPGFGPAEPLTVCNTPLTGCAAWAQQATGSDNQTYGVAVNGPTSSPVAANAAPNVYQGVVSGNYVTFYGVPVLPPAANAARVLRVTNIRINANGIGGVNSSVPVQASILASNWSALPLSNATPLVGFVQTSLSTSAASPGQVASCNQTLQQVDVFSFSEVFGAAFKTRVDPSVPGQTSGQSGALVQNRPGSGYNSEANFTMAISGEAPAGLADFGTRLKAVFRNIPPGVRLFVSLTNVTVDGTTGLVTGQVASPASTSSTSFAELVTNETAPFTVATPAPQTAPNGVNVVEITPLSGTTTATAVWEVVNTDPHSLDTLRFGVYVSYTAGPIAGGMGTVNLSYAPTSPATTASASAPIPRFLDTSISLPAVSVASCQNTSLTLTASPNPAVYGQPVTLTASASTGATGGVIFDEYSSTPISNGAVALANGKAQFTTTSVPAGSHTLFATYAGDANFLPATSSQISLTVLKAATSVVITSAVGQQPITATVTVNAPGTGTPTGTVQFWHGSAYFGTVALPQGQTNVSLIGVAVPGLTATYSGDGNFTGSVSAALSTPDFTCTSAAYSTRALRTEGLGEEIGDLLVTCKYGNALFPGQPIPQVNITVTLPVPITSRLLNDRVSEALLMIDEPNASLPNLGLYNPVPGFGGDEPFTLCYKPLTGCAAWAQQTVGTDTQTYEVAVNGPNAPPLAANAAPNAYQGVVNGNSVTFYGVPILPPAANGQRVLRITNIRVDASQIDPIENGLAASIVPSNPSALPVTVGYTPMPGFGITSLASTAALPAQLTACNAQNLRQATVLNYGELFSSVFKTRVDPTVQGQPSGQSAALVQNNPWIFYNSESTFTYSITGESPAGLADFGTRFKAVFKNIPTGVRLFASLTNVTVDGATGLITGPSPASTWPFAQLVTSETGPFTVATPFSQMAPNQVSVVEITPAAGSTTATAVWEVVTTNPNSLPNALETFKFAVYVSYAPSLSAAGAATVNLSYGPTSTSSTIPRFLDTSTALPALNIGSCQVTSSLTFTASPNPAVYGQPVTLTASAPTGATGGVIFEQAPSTPISNGAVALGNSKAQFGSASFPVGTTSLFATYGGDLNFLPAASNQVALTVQKAATTIAITSQQGHQPVTATVAVTAPGNGAPTGDVQFFNTSNFVGSVLLPQGQTTVSLNFLTLPGMTAVYSGDTNFTGSTSSPVGAATPRNLTLSASPNPSILGQTVTFTLSAANTASGSMAQFYDGSTLLGSASMNNGQATFSTSGLATGSHAIVASYLGDSASFGEVVNGLTSTVTLTAGSSSPTSGQPVTLTAQLGPAPPAGVAAPSGQVEFRDGGFTIGTGTVSSGTAALTVSNLAAGLHSFQAIYGGDRSWSAGHSSILALTVSPATTTTTLIPSLASPNQAVLTAVVAPSTPQAGTPTGSVQFVDTASKAVLASAPLAEGRASAGFSAGQLVTAAGVRGMAAVYAGDSDFGPSSSPALLELANAASFQESSVAPDEIVTAALPGMSAGVTIAVSGASASVSSGIAGQDRFVIPTAQADGLAVVSATDSTGATLATLVNVARTAPGLFAANANGQGVAAGYVVRISADGSQTSEDIAKWDAASNSWVAVPIHAGAAADRLFLVLFATGLRHHANANSVTATVNGVNAPVLYAGAQPVYPGVDQLNLQFPDGLAGTGVVKVAVTVDGRDANPVTITLE